MIEVGDLVRVKARNDVRVLGSGVFLVLKKQYTKEEGELVLCMQGSQTVIWLYMDLLEKV